MESRPYDWKAARTVIAYFSHAFLAPRLDPHERAPAWVFMQLAKEPDVSR